MTVIIQPQNISVTAEGSQENVAIVSQAVTVEASARDLDVSTGLPIIRELVGGEPYEGNYTVTPTTETQTLLTNGKLLSRDVTVDPIPSNYGLITWSGSILTVS